LIFFNRKKTKTEQCFDWLIMKSVLLWYILSFPIDRSLVFLSFVNNDNVCEQSSIHHLLYPLHTDVDHKADRSNRKTTKTSNKRSKSTKKERREKIHQM